MPDSIRVVRQILDLYVLVRIQVGQQVTPELPLRGFVFSATNQACLCEWGKWSEPLTLSPLDFYPCISPAGLNNKPYRHR